MRALRLLSNGKQINGKAKYQVFCFPHAGGGAAFYNKWAAAFNGSVEVFGVQYPGHFDRLAESPATHLEELINPILDEIGSYTDRPIVLFGHSLGALVAYTISLKLNKPPLLLGVSGRNSPVHRATTAIHKMGDEALLADLIRQGGTPADLLENIEAMQLFMPAIRADYQIAETYVFRPGSKLLDCPISLFFGANDPDIEIAAARDWRFMTNRYFKQHMFPGGHFYLTAQCSEVVLALQQDIEVALRGGIDKTQICVSR